MVSQEIKELIEFLRFNGGAVINGHKKFSVTPFILKDINKIIHSIKDDLFKPNISTTSLIHKYSNSNDLLFLYEFIKKTPKLKISHTVTCCNFDIDISDFTNLKYLEVYKVNVAHIKGIQLLRENLEMIICTRCLDKIGDILLKEDATNNAFMWSKLRHVVLARNGLVSLDNSFIHTPWLQYVDISYNHLCDLQPLACLCNLTYLNASFNNLIRVPILNEFSTSKLKVLILRNNYITDITGLISMENLRECDLSENCLTDHNSLSPLLNLHSLLSLNLSGNPISFHAMHRSLTCGYLHENTVNEKFELDKVILCNEERDFITYRPYKYLNSYKRDSFSTNMQFPSGFENILESSTSSISSTNSSNKKVKYARDAIITENAYEKDVVNKDISDVSVDHLETKKQIDQLLEQFGEDHWLHSGSGSVVQNILGIQTVVDCKPEEASCSFSSSSGVVVPDAKNEINIAKIIMEDSRNIGINEDMLQLSVYQTVENNKEQPENPKGDRATDSSADEQITSEDSVYHYTEESGDESSENESVSETEESLWLVTRINGERHQEHFLVLNETELKELDIITSKPVSRWNLDSIRRCAKVSSDPVTVMLQFQVSRTKDRYRKYIMEYADAKTLLATVQTEIENRSLSALDQIVLHCMKCSLTFCQEVSSSRVQSLIRHEEQYVCPTCGSTSVIQDDESLLPGKTGADQRANSAADKTIPSESPCLSNTGSATSLNRNIENDNNSESQTSCQESDIEIMSNPSQSSIEVLEVHGRMPSDDTVTLTNDSYQSTITENTALKPHLTNPQALTESSSSGSMTDSICTTYESQSTGTRVSHRISQNTAVEEVLIEESTDESSSSLKHKPPLTDSEDNNDSSSSANSNKNQVTTVQSYTSILEDLLQTVSSKLLSTTSVATTAEVHEPTTVYEYSYVDFSVVDHRLKLFFYDQYFQEHEHLVLLLKAERLYKPGLPQSCPGYFLISTKRVYFCKIIGDETTENVNGWLQKLDVYNVEKIKLIQPILWKQGVCIELDERTASSLTATYLALLLDETRTNNFINYSRDLGMFRVQKTDCETRDRILNEFVTSNEDIRNFSLLKTISVFKNNVETHKFDCAGLIITNNELFIIKGELDWLLPNSTLRPSLALSEKISNVINVEMSNESIVLVFIDETSGEEPSWKLKTVTESSSVVILDAIKEPWQELFGIPLQLTPVSS